MAEIETDTRHKSWRLGRFQFGFHRYIHTYPLAEHGKRYVLQPWFLFDYGRKEKR